MRLLCSDHFRHRAAGAMATLLALPLVAGNASAQAHVYRCADDNGRVSYQAQPCANAGAGKPVDIETRPAQPAPQPRPQSRYAGAQARHLPLAVEDTAPAPIAAPAPPFNAREVPAPVRSIMPQAPNPRAQRVLEPQATSQGLQRWGAEADVIVVSAYQFSARSTQVHVNHPGRPVMLVLSSYQGTEWKVLPAPGTSIKGIVVASYEQRATVLAPPGVPVVQDELPHAYETGSLGFRELIGKLHLRYGVDKVTGFRGGYTLPEVVPVTGPYAADPNFSLEGLRPEVPRLRMHFDLMSIDGRRLPWTNTGPRDGKHYAGIVHGGGLRAMNKYNAMATNDSGSEAFALEGNGGTLLWFPQGFGGPSKKLEMPAELPALSWGSGLAWDTRRGVLALVSFGGEGYFYRYDTRNRKWLGARSLQNRDLQGLSYSAANGGYVAISNTAELLVFSDQGEVEEIRPLAKVLPDLDSTYDRHNSRLEGLTAVADGNAVALVNVRNGSVTHIWTYELGSRKAQLTYKMIED